MDRNVNHIRGVLFILAIILSSPAPALASDLELKIAKREPSAFDGYFDQYISVKNTGTRTMAAMVECGFLKNPDTIVDTGSAAIVNLKPGQTSYQQISVKGAYDRADCRISSSYVTGEP